MMDQELLLRALMRAAEKAKANMAKGDPTAMAQMNVLIDDFLTLTKRMLAVVEGLADTEQDRAAFRQAVALIEVATRSMLS